MKIKFCYLLVLVLVIAGNVFASVSNLNFSPTGNYAKLTPKEGLVASIFLLYIFIFGELHLFPFKFTGRRRRQADESVLQTVRSLDQCDCLLRYLCELEATRIEKDISLDNLTSDLLLLNIARRESDPALAFRQDPGSPYLAFDTAVSTGAQGRGACASVFSRCHLNVTEIAGDMAF